MAKCRFSDSTQSDICKAYFTEHLSTPQLGKKFKCSKATIENIIHRRGFKLRTLKESFKFKNRRGDSGSNWKGGKLLHISRGIILIYNPDHPHCNSQGYTQEHRLVMEKQLGRYLEPKEVVHHKNRITTDNSIANLTLFANSGDHIRYHLLGAKRDGLRGKIIVRPN